MKHAVPLELVVAAEQTMVALAANTDTFSITILDIVFDQMGTMAISKQGLVNYETYLVQNALDQLLTNALNAIGRNYIFCRALQIADF